jgi:hypothetical protein
MRRSCNPSRILKRGCITFGLRRDVERRVADVSDDSDNLVDGSERGGIVAVVRNRDALPDGARAWPMLSGKRFVDDDDRRCPRVIGIVECTTGKDGNPHGLEVPGTGTPVLHIRSLGRRWHRLD